MLDLAPGARGVRSASKDMFWFLAFAPTLWAASQSTYTHIPATFRRMSLPRV